MESTYRPSSQFLGRHGMLIRHVYHMDNYLSRGLQGVSSAVFLVPHPGLHPEGASKVGMFLKSRKPVKQSQSSSSREPGAQSKTDVSSRSGADGNWNPNEEPEGSPMREAT